MTAPAVERQEKRSRGRGMALTLPVKALEVLGILAVGVLMLHTVALVLGRNLFDYQLPATQQWVTHWWMPIIVFLGLIVAARESSHISVGVLAERLPPRQRALVTRITLVVGAIVLIILGVLTFQGALFQYERKAYSPGAISLVIWPVYFVVPVGLFAWAALWLRRAVAKDPVRLTEPTSELDVPPVDGSAAVSEAETATTGTKRRANSLMWIMFLGAVLVLVLPHLVDLDKRTTAGLQLLGMLFLMATGLPVALAMAIPGLNGIWAIGGTSAVVSTGESLPYNQAASWQLSVIPMFVLMGMVIWQSGLAARLFEAGRAWLGWLPGGLGVAANFTGAALAAASGSSIAISYAVGKISTGPMLRAGYKKWIIVGVVAMVGALGQMIPPSLQLIVYSGLAQTSTAAQLLAGFVPGILLALGYAILIVLASRKGEAVREARQARYTRTQRLLTLGGVLPVGVIIAGVIVGMFLGIFTPTEAGAMGAAAAIIIGLQRSGGRLSRLWSALREATSASAAVLVLLVGAAFLNRLLAMSGIPAQMSRWLKEADVSPTLFIVLVALMYIFLGMILDPLAMMVLTVPILMPALDVLGIDPIWFGVFVVLMGEVALVTPPVGLLSFVVYRLVNEPSTQNLTRFSIGEVFNGALRFLLVNAIVLVLLYIFPDLVLFVPNAMRGS